MGTHDACVKKQPTQIFKTSFDCFVTRYAGFCRIASCAAPRMKIDFGFASCAAPQVKNDLRLPP